MQFFCDVIPCNNNSSKLTNGASGYYIKLINHNLYMDALILEKFVANKILFMPCYVG